MTAYIKQHRLACLLLLVGLICAAVLCAQRMSIEKDDCLVCAVMTHEDAEVLSFVPDGIRLFDGENMLDGAALLVEDENQYSFIPADGTEYIPGSSVRCFKLIEKYASRYASFGYDGAQDIVNLLFRAVTDRNIRVLWLTPFISAQTGEVITDGEIYQQVLDSLAARISSHGLTLTDGSFSVFPEHEPNRLLLWGVVIGIFGAADALLCELFKSRRLRAVLLIIFCVGLSLVSMSASAFPAVPALAAACMFPCLSVCVVVSRLKQTDGSSFRARAVCFLSAALPAFLLAVMGGLFVSALQSSDKYMLAVLNFRGVKLSQLVPLCFAAALVFLRLYGREGIRDILSGRKVLFVLLLAALAAVSAIFLLRTGDDVLAIGTLEWRFRNALENALIVRPRTKEFLIAWPCLALACVLASAGRKRWMWPFAIVSAIGFSSVVNTFCHSRAPVWLSLDRSLLGLALGLVICAAVIGVSCLFHRKKA